MCFFFPANTWIKYFWPRGSRSNSMIRLVKCSNEAIAQFLHPRLSHARPLLCGFCRLSARLREVGGQYSSHYYYYCAVPYLRMISRKFPPLPSFQRCFLLCCSLLVLFTTGHSVFFLSGRCSQGPLQLSGRVGASLA